MFNKKGTRKKEKVGNSKMRQIIIETDGTNINIAKAEVAGNLEMVAILQNILYRLSRKNN